MPPRLCPNAAGPAQNSHPCSTASTAIYSLTGGFALTRTLAGESELLTLAVHPTRQRRGIARELLSDWINHASPIADLAFLEVAADNAGAIALYSSLSFDESGRRKGYYRRKTGPAMDAIMMTRAIS